MADDEEVHVFGCARLRVTKRSRGRNEYELVPEHPCTCRTDPRLAQYLDPPPPPADERRGTA